VVLNITPLDRQLQSVVAVTAAEAVHKETLVALVKVEE
jgi:hypothetical protein